ncbi:molecular chaperone [Pseudomonas sp. JDS28PS106]|uniref:fimbrial biogenesis chaperone n=1 Tax=Pseudomonas sp. JDS28PS106 TaxID=2497235 RepID=UPI002FD6C1D0
MFSTFFRAAAFAGALLWVGGSQASIVLNTTRVIYNGADKEASFGVLNSGNAEILLQTWLESGADSNTQARPPFAVTPALTRMPGNGRQLLRLIYAGSGLPQDRESVFWLNVQEIPQAAAENTLQIAVRQRIKVFFRPKSLSGDAQDAPQALQWRLSGSDAVLVENPGPYHVSMIRIAARQANTELAREDARMIAPGETVRLTLSRKAGSGPVTLSFNSINDFGGQVAYRATLKPGVSTVARRADPE